MWGKFAFEVLRVAAFLKLFLESQLPPYHRTAELAPADVGQRFRPFPGFSIGQLGILFPAHHPHEAGLLSGPTPVVGLVSCACARYPLGQPTDGEVPHHAPFHGLCLLRYSAPAAGECLLLQSPEHRATGEQEYESTLT